MKHVSFYSGGIGSWQATKRIIDKEGKENVISLFTDTLSEDKDLYRFLVETIFNLYGTYNQEMLDKLDKIPDIPLTDVERAEKRAILKDVSEISKTVTENFIWIIDGRDIWQVYEHERYLPNNRIAPCTKNLKKLPAERYIKKNFSPGEAILYLGMDWTELHRTESAIKKWDPYEVRFPMTEEPYLAKDEMIKELEKVNINVPAMYLEGFPHNNCMGFCCRAGQGHFAHLLKKRPDFYYFCEKKELEYQKEFNIDKSYLKRKRKGITEPLTLEKLRNELETAPEQIDLFDIGGCGCFTDFE